MVSARVVDQTVSRDFPYPIASAWRRVKVQSSDSDRIKYAHACQEIAMRTLVSCAVLSGQTAKPL